MAESIERAPAFPVFSAEDFSLVRKEKALLGSARPSLSYWQDAWLRLRGNRQALASLFIVIGLLVFTMAGPFFWQVDPAYQELSRISEPPGMTRMAMVIADVEEFKEIIAADVPESPAAPASGGTSLAAPASVELMGVPSAQSVRIRWSAVAGANAFVVYRSTEEPKGREDLGLPISTIEGGNRLSLEDKFDLTAPVYWYSVVAKNVDESTSFRTLKVQLQQGISLADARALRPGDDSVQPGSQVRLAAHPLGTDYLGRDMLARLIYGARVSLFIGFFAPLLYVLIGILIGGVSGYFGGRVDNVLMRMTDFVLALPFLLFMILFRVVMGGGPGENGIIPMLVALIVLSWTGSARLVRGQVLQLRESEFVQASRLLGARPLYLILRHLLPNTLGVVLVYLTFAVPSAIFTEAFLSFIGMGVAPPTPSWGSMCNDGVKSMLTHPHEFFFPALLISITVLAFNLLGDGLRDALDPKMRSRG